MKNYFILWSGQKYKWHRLLRRTLVRLDYEAAFYRGGSRHIVRLCEASEAIWGLHYSPFE